MIKNRKDVLFFGIIFFIIDQSLKLIISKNIILDSGFEIIKDVLNIHLVHNTGAAFSILSGNRLLLIAISVITLIFFIVFLFNQNNVKDLEVFTYSMLLGGILGNLFDRIFRGYVIDFISFKIFEYSFPIFNFADICIVLSLIILIIENLKGDLWKE